LRVCRFLLRKAGVSHWGARSAVRGAILHIIWTWIYRINCKLITAYCQLKFGRFRW